MVEFLGLVAAVLGIVGIAAIISIPIAILRGWVFSWLWLWFAVPLGMPVIGVVNAIGLAGLVGFLTSHTTPNDDSKLGENFATGIILPFFVLGFGYLIHLFM